MELSARTKKIRMKALVDWTTRGSTPHDEFTFTIQHTGHASEKIPEAEETEAVGKAQIG